MKRIICFGLALLYSSGDVSAAVGEPPSAPPVLMAEGYGVACSQLPAAAEVQTRSTSLEEFQRALRESDTCRLAVLRTRYDVRRRCTHVEPTGCVFSPAGTTGSLHYYIPPAANW